VKQIILYGDSLFGKITKPLMRRLEDYSEDCLFHNFASGGFTSHDLVSRVRFIASLPYDNIIISVGLNDVLPEYEITLEDSEYNMRQIIMSLDASKVLFLLPPLTVDKLQNPDRIRLSVKVAEFRGMLRTLCDELNIQYLSVNELDSIDSHAEDGVHISDSGYRIMLKEIGLSLKDD